MPDKIRDIMSTAPVTIGADASTLDAANAMAENGIGDVLVMTDGRLSGLITDRDLVVRVLAEGKDPSSTRCGEVCSTHLHTLSPDDDTHRAVELVRDRAVRRIPIVEDGVAVGMLTIGDLALEHDPDSALADISVAQPNE